MRFSSRLLAIAFAVFLACACFAQGGGGGRGGQRRNNTNLTGLVFRADVQSDLALTDDEKTKLTALRETFRGQGGAGAAGGTPPTPEERAARQADQEKQIDAILTPDQSRRLREIQIQLEGPRALTHKSVQAALGLSTSQVQQITDLMRGFGEANRSIQQKVQSGELDRAASRTEMQKNTATLSENLNKVLTPEQASKLKDMGGKPFTPAAPAGSAL